MNPDLESDTDPTHEEELPESPDDEEETDDYEHLQSLDDGAGCTEIWEHLSEGRDE